MDGNDEKSKKIEERIDVIYKNLEYISKSYFSSEGIFPFWESVYALIVGQLLVAYFTSNKCEPKIILVVSGIIFSVIWFVVVSIGWHYSDYRAKTMKHLQYKLIREYQQLSLIKDEECLMPVYKFYPESPINDEHGNENIIRWRLENVWSLLIELRPNLQNLKRSWCYRRWIPLILILIWSTIFIHENYSAIYELIVKLLSYVWMRMTGQGAA